MRRPVGYSTRLRSLLLLLSAFDGGLQRQRRRSMPVLDDRVLSLGASVTVVDTVI